MAMEDKNLGSRPQGCFIKLLDGEKEVDYELHNIHYVLHPTGVAVCTFNTPKTKNCLAINQQWEIFATLEHMVRDENVLVAVWTGTGDTFNAGADLRGDLQKTMPKHIREQMLSRGMGPVANDYVLANMTKAFWDFPKPSIVAVNGPAVGGGANMALMNFHDLVICSTKARFMYPFTKLGFTPELSSSFMAPYLVGMARAKEMMFLGDWMAADEAKQLGFANKVVAPEQLMPEAMKLAERLCLSHPASLKFSKKILNHHVRQNLDAILKAESDNINQSLAATGGPAGVAKWMKEKQASVQKTMSKL